MPRPSWLLRIHRLSRLPRLTQLPLGAEIVLILVVKIAILTVLAKAFFSEPQARKMRMPTEQVEQHLLAPAPAPVSATTATTATIAVSAVSAASAASAPATPTITTSTVSTFTSTSEVTHASH